MKKSEILKNYQLSKLDDNTVFIKSKDFYFSYTKADSVVKDEFKGKYKYFGGLQCNVTRENEIQLEKWLCELAENALNIKKDYSSASKILQKYEDKNECHFQNAERKFILEAMEEYSSQSYELIINACNE